jgi:dolichyl-phosphate-mannose-protein mannosyltransferase
LRQVRIGTGRIYDALVTWRAMVRRHWPFAILLVVGVALRAAATIAYRPALVYIDTPRYLGGDQGGLDPLGYTYLLLRPVLAAGGGLTGVAVAQHALGLAMAACLYALATRHGAGRWLAALAAAPVLLDAYQVQAEQTIMPDVLFEALIVAAMTLLLWPQPPIAANENSSPHLASVPGADRDAAARGTWAALVRVGCGAVLLGVSATVRQVGVLLVVPLLAYVLTAATSRPPAWQHRAMRAAGAVAVFALPVVGYMAFSQAMLGTGFRLSNMNDAYLYGRLAYAADCAALKVPGYARPLCPAPPTAARLGVDGLSTDPSSAVFSYRPPPGVTRGTATRSFDQAVLTQQPLRVARSVASDAIKVFALTRGTRAGDPPVARWQFQETYPVYRAADEAVLGRNDGPQVPEPLAAALRNYQLHSGYTPGPLLLAFLVTGIFGCFTRRRHPALARACLLATALALTTAGGADLYEFSWRYQLPLLVTLPLAGTLGATALLRLAVTRRSGGGGTMSRCTTTRTSPRSGPSPAALSTPTTGSGSAETRSSAVTGPGAPTPS